MNYMEFLRSKITIAPQSGFEPQDIHSQNRPALDIVEDASGLEIEVIGNIHDNPELLESRN